MYMDAKHFHENLSALQWSNDTVVILYLQQCLCFIVWFYHQPLIVSTPSVFVRNPVPGLYRTSPGAPDRTENTFYQFYSQPLIVLTPLTHWPLSVSDSPSLLDLSLSQTPPLSLTSLCLRLPLSLLDPLSPRPLLLDSYIFLTPRSPTSTTSKPLPMGHILAAIQCPLGSNYLLVSISGIRCSSKCKLKELLSLLSSCCRLLYGWWIEDSQQHAECGVHRSNMIRRPSIDHWEVIERS